MTSPRATERSTSSKATAVPKRLVIQAFLAWRSLANRGAPSSQRRRRQNSQSSFIVLPHIFALS